MDQRMLAGWLKKNRYVLIVLLAGILLMVLPEISQTPAQSEPVPVQEEDPEDLEVRLEGILSRIDGAGNVALMLTESTGEEIIYQSDGEGTDTVLITDAQRNEHGLIRTRQPPAYRGAIVVCDGADSASVRLALVEAVSNVTGLGADRITILKMKQEELK